MLTEAEQNRLIIENTALVAPIAADYRGSKDIPWDDILSEGTIGLVMAARSWEGRGPFRAYAEKSIRGYILNFIKEWEEYLPFESDLEDEDEDRVVWWDSWGYVPTEQWTDLPITPELIRMAYEDIRDKTAALKAALLSLTKRERQMVRAAFLQSPAVKLEQIARDHGVSYKRTTNIVYGAIAKMRKVVLGYERNRNSVAPAGALSPPSVVAI